MSVAQLIKNDNGDYFADLYNQNKTAEYVKSPTRVAKVTNDPSSGTVLTCTSLGAGTYQSPDVLQFTNIFGPTGVGRSISLYFLGSSLVTMNPSEVINSVPIVYNEGYTYVSGLGQLYQTFANGRSYQVDASLSILMDNTQTVGEMVVGLYLWDASAAAPILLSEDYIPTQPMTPAISRGVSLSGQFIGQDPADYVYLQVTGTTFLPLTVNINFVRMSMSSI